MRRLGGAILILAAVSFSTPARIWAEGEAPTPQEPVITRQLRLSIPVASEGYSPVPEGFAEKHFKPVHEISFYYGRSPLLGKAGHWFNALLAVPQYGTTAFLSAGGGARLLIGNVPLSLGAEINHQALPSRRPMGGGYLDRYEWSLIAGLELPGETLTPFGDLKFTERGTADLAEIEALKTKISWGGLWRLRPGVRMDLSIVKLEASFSIYHVGGVAIASKEFAYQIAEQMVYQPELAAGVALGKGELWLRANQTIPQRDDDTVAYLYSVPSYLSDNLMSKSVLRGEIRWNF